MDTIFAMATPPGRAGVSVIRVSGTDAFAACEKLAGDVPQPRLASLRVLRGADGGVLDQALVLSFSRPNSFTGEDVVELHVHGSVAVVDAVLRELSSIAGCRIAEPGEFTRRALQNGKLDLTQIEGLADLLDAQTEAQRVQAQSIASGAFRSLVEDLRKLLIRSAALLEAVIDFADEDVPEDVSEEVVLLLDHAMEIMRKEVDGQRFAERVRNGFEVVIVGPPNSGKSTLLNALAGREAAITSHHAGTTRDAIEVQMDLGGVPVTLVDTAGLREAQDPVERMGVERARSRAELADVRVFLQELDEMPILPVREGDLVFRSKADLLDNPENGISGTTGFNVDVLTQRLEFELRRRVARAGLATRGRHAAALTRSSEYLMNARRLVLGVSGEYDIVAEEIRAALNTLDSLIGRVDVENLLDVIFASFCVGK